MPLEGIDPIRVPGGYCLVPDGQVAAKPYKLLRQGASRVAIAKYAWSAWERLGLLRTDGDHLFLARRGIPCAQA